MTAKLYAPIFATLDPVRLALPSSPQTFTNEAFVTNVPGFSILVNSSGSLTLGAGGDITTPAIPNYIATANAWWGRSVIRPVGGVPLLHATPGNYWEARCDVVAGSFTIPSGTFGAWSRIANGPFSTTWSFDRTTLGSETGTARVSFRPFGSSVTAGFVDFALTLTLS